MTPAILSQPHLVYFCAGFSRNDDTLGFVDVVLKVRELKVWTPEEKSWWKKKPSKPKALILNNGKTTYLVSLCGKCNLPSEGVVTVNGRNVSELEPGEVEILPQMDVFMDCLSVKEHLIFMTEMKIGSAKNSRNNTVLNTIMDMLKLKAHENTLIKSLSGGERRLLSLASSLLSNPQILICDEPTTGLDSYNASLVVGLLKGLSLTGKIVICSVHQPSSDLFKEFNSISLMSEGKLLFHGTHENCRNLFESLNLRCPKNYNPAEFYIKAVSPSPATNVNYVDRILENNRNRFHECDETCCETHTMPRPPVCNRSWSKQVQLLMWRFSIRLRRSYKGLAASLLLSTVPRCIIWPIPFVTLTASAVELPNHSLTVLELYLALIISGFASTAYGLGMGALFISTGMMADVMPCADLPLFLMSGAFLRISSLPFWLYPFKFISHFYYAMDAISNIYWRQIGDIECPTNTTRICVKDGAAVLLENGYSNNFVVEDTIGLLFVATLWSILGYWGLKREERKGYAY
ncbi:Protein white [Papilio machaon]|uniref:Protein white n=1 Tax=Papilio machaon TaxID=76193 RepID=A0A194QVC7_PAPMA|nr:Protein white [Papilio machaon]